MITIKMAYLDRIYDEIKQDVESKVLEVVQSGKFILGDYVYEFENALSRRYFFPFVAGVASGTDALMIALRACGVSEGDEVILPAFTIFIDGAVIKMLGARPIFVDVNKEDYNIASDQIKSVITKKTKAIIAVHLFGLCADIGLINTVAQEYGIPVIEDACQAIGAKYGNLYAGNLGAIGCFSFYPTKNLGAMGDGGLMTAKSKQLFEAIQLFHLHGIKHTPYIQDVWAYNSRLDGMQAAILNTKLKYLSKWEDKRRQIASYYKAHISSKKITLPKEIPNRYHVYHQYTIRTDFRKEFSDYLASHGINFSVFYPKILPLQPAYKDDASCQPQHKWPVSEELSKTVLSIPISPQMTEEEIDYIVDRINTF